MPLVLDLPKHWLDLENLRFAHAGADKCLPVSPQKNMFLYHSPTQRWRKTNIKLFCLHSLTDTHTFRQEELPEGLTMVIQTNMNPHIAVRLLLLTPSPNEAPNASV